MSLLFGVNVSTAADPSEDPIAGAREAEELGFDFVSANDHPCGTAPNFETWTMLSWIAASTSRIAIATRVLGLPYRAPPMVAKMAASFDQLSGGRLILGLGGGASDDEFRAFGLPILSPKHKIQALEEEVRIIRGLWSEPSFTFEGKFFHTVAADIEPKPARRIPIWLGTFGIRGLDLTGRLADGWIPSLEMAPPEVIPAMRERISEGTRAAGRSPDEITCVYNLQIRVDEMADAIPHVVCGSPSAVVDQLSAFVQLGFSAFNFLPSGTDRSDQVRRIATEIVPTLRSLYG